MADQLQARSGPASPCEPADGRDNEQMTTLTCAHGPGLTGIAMTPYRCFTSDNTSR